MSDRFRILITGQMAEAGLELLKKNKKFQTQYSVNLQGDALHSALKETQGLIIRTETDITEELLVKAPNLRVICRAGIGVDHIDLKAAAAREVVVMNTPEGNRNAVVEMTLGLMISLARFIPQASAALRAGGWSRNSFTGSELRGKTLGIIGLGNIGSRVALMAESFGMKVIAHDPYKKDLRIEPLEKVQKLSDFISFHTPLTKETRGMANGAFFRKLKSGAFFINTSRGKVCVEEELLKALESGHIRGAALDVFESEPLKKDHGLTKLPQVILTPHTAGQTHEAQDNMSTAAASQIIDFFEQGKVTNPCQE